MRSRLFSNPLWILRFLSQAFLREEAPGKRSAFICACMLLFSLLLAVSCRQEQEGGREYDLHTSELLLTTGDELFQADERPTGFPPELLAELETNRLTSPLAQVLQAQVVQRELIQEANRLLAAERYNDLAALLEKAQREGIATTQLMELNGLPQALQALRLYCARRPYERAADLEQNLDFLRPWLRQLQSLSPAFQLFYQEQQTQLLAMRQQEAAAAEEQVLKRLDWLLACERQKGQASDYLAQVAEAFPQLPILKLLQRQPNAGWQAAASLRELLATGDALSHASTRERLSIELAVALAWNSLGTAETAVLAQEWKKLPAVSLTGTFLQASCLKDHALFENAIAAWQRNASPTEQAEDSPAWLSVYLECLLGKDAQSADAWRCPAVDFATALRRTANLSH